MSSATPTRTSLGRESSPSLSPGLSSSFSASLRARTVTSLYAIDDVVLSLGSRWWTFGFAGEASPRGSCDVSELGVPDEVGLWTLDVLRAWQDDEDLELAVEAKVQAGLRQIFHRRLMVDPKQRKVIVIENPFLPTCVKTLIARVLFDRLHVLSVGFAPTPLLAVLPTGTLTALVLDCGYQETSLLPIYAARPLAPFVSTTPRAGLLLLRHLRRLLLRFGSYMPPITSSNRPRPIAVPPEVLTVNVLEDIKARGLFVGDRYEAPPRLRGPIEEDAELLELEKEYMASSTASSATVSVPHPGSSARGTLLIPGWIRQRAAEILFEHDIDEPGLAALVVDALERLPMDLRKTFAGSILLIGGTSMLPGFRKRLLADIYALLDKPKVAPLRSSIGILNDRAPAFNRSLLPWIGASLAGALRTGAEEVTREKWVKEAEETDGEASRKRKRQASLLTDMFSPPL